MKFWCRIIAVVLTPSLYYSHDVDDDNDNIGDEDTCDEDNCGDDDKVHDQDRYGEDSDDRAADYDS